MAVITQRDESRFADTTIRPGSGYERQAFSDRDKGPLCPVLSADN